MAMPKKVPDDVNEILKDIQMLGSKKLVAEKYGCSYEAINQYLWRNGFKILSKKVWVLETK